MRQSGKNPRRRSGTTSIHPTGRAAPTPRPARKSVPVRLASKDPLRLLELAIARRNALPLRAATEAVRLFHGSQDGLDGLVLERFGSVLIAQVYEGRSSLNEAALMKWCEHAISLTKCTAVYRKSFAADRSQSLARLEAEHRDPTPLIGIAAPEEFAVVENRLRLLVRPYDGYSVGLFLDQRDNRRSVRERSRGKRVLNTFSYTGGFTVAAAAGGAASTVSVDVSKRFLEWSKRNLSIGDFDLANHRFICSDVFDYFKRARRQGTRFDLLILDPPTFGRSKQSGATFSIRDDLPRLIGEGVDLLDSGGELVVSTNHRATHIEQLESLVLQAGARRGLRIMDRPSLPPDFAGDRDHAKSLWCRVR